MLPFQFRKESQSCYAGSFLTSPIQLNHMFPADIESIELQYIGSKQWSQGGNVRINDQLTQSWRFLPCLNEWDQQFRVFFRRCGTSDMKYTYLFSYCVDFWPCRLSAYPANHAS